VKPEITPMKVIVADTPVQSFDAFVSLNLGFGVVSL